MFSKKEATFRLGEATFGIKEENFRIKEATFRLKEAIFDRKEGKFRLGEAMFRIKEGKFRLGGAIFRIKEATFRLKKAIFGKASLVVAWRALAQNSCGIKTTVETSGLTVSWKSRALFPRQAQPRHSFKLIFVSSASPASSQF
jgi:hypothetical protein